ncbi:MAG: c-type cytochrome biogenesis protein CcsB [bacterium]
MRGFLLLLLILLFISFSISKSDSNFDIGYQFLRDNVNISRLDSILIKGDRVELWSNYAEYIIRTLKDGGDIDDSNIGDNASLFLLHLTIDDEYRKRAKVLFIKKDDDLGIYKSEWVCLDEFESDVMVRLQKHLTEMGTSAKKSIVEARAEDITYRAELLKRLELELLWLIPPEKGIVWQKISTSTDDTLKELVLNLKDSYIRRDSLTFRDNFDKFTSKLNEYSNRVPSWKIFIEKINNIIPSFTLTFILYLISALFLFLYIPLKREFLRITSEIIIIIGFSLQTSGLILRSLIGLHLPVTNMYEYLSLMSWTIILISFIFHKRFKLPVISAVGLSVSIILMVIASLFPANISDQLVPALKSYWLTIHVILACLGEGAFGVGFVCAIMYIIRVGSDTERADMFDEVSYRAIAIGYPLFTIGALIAGAIWAQRAWGIWWNWDPKETCSLIVWLVATAYLHSRLVRGWRGLRSSVLAIIIFALSLFTLFANLIFGGLHSYEG